MPFFIPFAISAIAGAGFWATISSFIFRALFWLIPWILHYGLLALGVGAVTYIGMDFALDTGIDLLTDKYAQIPVELVDILTLMGVPDAITMITSTAASAITLKVTAGTTRWVANKPAVLKA